jgi:hypothetical protein
VANPIPLYPLLATARLPPSNEEIHREVKEVFARREFLGGERHDWALEWLLDALKWLGSLRHDNPTLFWIILIACCTLLVLLLGHITWTVRRLFTAAREGRQDATTAAERQRFSQDSWEEARQAAARGDFTEAVRFLFLSLVYRFDENGRVNFQRAYTNREYLRLLGDDRLRTELRVFVDTLDANWYGEHPTEESRYRECLQLYESLVHA